MTAECMTPHAGVAGSGNPKRLSLHPGQRFWAKNGYRVTSLPEHGAKRCSSLPLPLARWWTAAEAKSSESCPAPQRASGLIANRSPPAGRQQSHAALRLITAVSVTAHRYIPGEASEELYKDTLEPGTYRVTFDAPAVADSLAVRGAELSERGVNHCTLTVSKAAEVCVTGRKYSDSATVLRREAANLPSNAQGNEVSVPDATLVSPDRAAAVAARVLDYYAQRYEQTFRMVAGDEKLADRLIVESFGGEMVRGVVDEVGI